MVKKIIALSVLFLVSSCKSYYGDGLSGGSYSYMEVPMGKEKGKVSKNYLGGRYNKDMTYYGNEKNVSGELSYHYGVSTQNISYALGGGLFLGRYNVNNLKETHANLNGKYTYYGVSLRSKISYNWEVNKDVHWRVVGLQVAWNIERGSFYDFKKKLLDIGSSEEADLAESFLSTAKGFSNFSIYPYSEVSLRLGKDFVMTPNFGLGYSMSDLSFRSFYGLSVSYKGKINIWSTVLNSQQLYEIVANGFLPESDRSSKNIQIGMSYAF